MKFLSRLIKCLGVTEKSRAGPFVRTRVMRFEPLEDRCLLTAAPDDFTVVRIGETQVGLHWTPRPEQEPDVTGYEVQVSINGIDNWRPFFGHEPIVQSEILSDQALCDLDPTKPCYFDLRDVYRSYYFRIQSLPAESTPIWSLVAGSNARPVNTPEDNTVKVSAIAHPQIDVPLIAATIELRWPEELAYQDADYSIYRKTKDELSFTLKETLTYDGQNPINGWTDDDLGGKTAYEYKVERTRNFSPTHAFFKFGKTAIGYVYAGVDVPLDDLDSTIESPGTVILIVDNTQAAALTAELDRLERDLIAEGWGVKRHDVAPHDDDDFISVANRDAAIAVRVLINTDYIGPANVTSVFLIGHVPIPMSGHNCPDGHGERPMPTDAFYGEMDGVVDIDDDPGGDWTDATYVPDAACAQPVADVDNDPDDGAFDQKTVPTDGDGKPVELMVGRVDMRDLPDFQTYNPGLTEAELETELLRRYLDKDHAFRTGQVAVERKARIRDRFARTYSSTGAWQTLSGFFGPAEKPTELEPDNIDVNKWTDTTWPLAVGLRSLRRAGLRSWATVSWGISA